MLSNLKNIHKDVLKTTSSLNSFLNSNEETTRNQLNTCKSLYDLSRRFEGNVADDYLDELLTDGFDFEQVWQQIDLVNKYWQTNLNQQIKEVDTTSQNGINENLKEDECKKDENDDDEEEDDVEDGEENDEKEDIDSEDENLKRILLKLEDNEKDLEKDEDFGGQFGGDDEEDEYDTDIKDIKKSKKVKFSEDVMFQDSDSGDDEDAKKKTEKPSKAGENYALNMLKKNLKKTDKRAKVVSERDLLEDKFFKLDQMEDFLDRQDAKEQRKMDGEEEEEKDDEEEEDDDIDVFQDFSSGEDEDDEDDDGDAEKVGKFDEFFDRPENKDDEMKEDDDEGDEDDDDEEEENENGVEDGDDDEDVQLEVMKEEVEKSKFEKNQEILGRKIKHLEESLVGEKGWQMRGEVEGVVRPVDSLINEALEHETNVKEAPIITEEVTKSIEEKIIQRLKDNIWDGPKRKVKVKETAFDLEMKRRKKVVMDEEKHKLSLAEEYEKEYLDREKKDEAKLPQAMEDISTSMQSLFDKLDALSNYHFTPKPPTAEGEIVTYLPAINMEEPAPVIHSHASALADHEIMGAIKRDLVGETERTSTDKLRERRLKKKQQHLKRLKSEDIEKIKKIKTDKSNAKFKSKTDAHLETKKKGLKEKSKRKSKY